MIRRNQHVINLLNGLFDGLLNFFSIYIAYWLRFDIFENSVHSQSYDQYFDIGLLNAVVSVALYGIFHLYDAKRRTTAGSDVSIVLRTNAVNVLLLGMLFYVRRLFDFSRLLLVFYYALSSILVVSKHTTVRFILSRIRERGRNLKHVLVIGSGLLASTYCHEISANAHLGYVVDGIISCGASPLLSDETKIRCLGSLDQVNSILASVYHDEVVIAIDEAKVNYMQMAIDACNVTGCRYSVIPFFCKYCFSAASPQVMTLGALQVYDICASPLDSSANRIVKRLIDIVASILLLLVSSPLFIITAIVIKCTSPGPILFKQKRMGKNRNAFNMYKFRSMCVNSQQDTAWTQKGDVRITPFGHFIRRTSIDELPQLFNIIGGDMSLVGPRPEIPHHVSRFKKEIPYYMARHQIRPGLTGWAQVNGLRGDTSIEDRIQHDLYYIYNWSIWLDIQIVLKTVLGGMLQKTE